MNTSEKVSNAMVSALYAAANGNWPLADQKLDFVKGEVQKLERDIAGLVMVNAALTAEIDKPRQKKLNQVGKAVIELNSQLTEGFLTINEYLGRMAEIAMNTERLDLAGLTCPVTGLTYPTESEINAIDRRMNHDV
jgi:hypothetical protein